MKVLNLDALAKVERTVTIGGVKYDVEEMTVENFIETTKAAERLSVPGITPAEQVEETVKMIQRSLPKCPEEKLRKLNLEQLAVVSKFLRNELDEEIGTGEEGDEKK